MNYPGNGCVSNGQSGQADDGVDGAFPRGSEVSPAHLGCYAAVGLAMSLAVMCGCATRSPVTSGMVLQFTSSSPILTSNQPEFEKTLQVKWLGTASYLVQLGDRAILTDPFYTHQSLTRVALGRPLKFDPATVSHALAGLTIPQAIFVGHSHYDHLLDAAQCLRQPGWSDVPVYGSATTRNILAGFAQEYTNSWRMVYADSAWREIAEGIRYKAVRAEHGRQVPFLPLLYGGSVNEPRTKHPVRASDFKAGDSYAFIFELSNEFATHTIYFNGAAHADDEGLPDASVENIDVAILCVPTWKLAGGYPENIIRRLEPRHIVASHFNNFFQVNDQPTEVVPLAEMDAFLIRTQESVSYPRFESIRVPSVGSVLWFSGDE